MSRWKAVVFDLDDTLYPESDYVLSGFRVVAEWAEGKLGIPTEQGFAELKGLFERHVRGNTFDQWLNAHGGCANTYVTQLVQVYRNHLPTIKPFPEVPTTLAFLHQRYRLGIVSDGYRDVQQRKLDALGIAPFFPAVVFSDEFGRDAWKPSVIPFNMVLSRLGAEPRSSVYVADNPIKDFFGARKIGMFTIQIQRPDGEYKNRMPPSPEYAPDCIITSLVELENVLELVSR